MQTTTLYKSLGLAFGALLLTACASKGEIEEGTSQVEEAQNQVTTEATQGVEEAKLSGEELKAQAEAALREQTVFYFEFASSAVKEEGKKALKAHAKYLSASRTAEVTLHVHADDCTSTGS